MGFFNRRKKNKPQQVLPMRRKEQKPFDITYSRIEDGRLQIEFINNKANFARGYDTTRLIVNNESVKLNNREVQNFFVSWYNHDDAIVLDRNTGEGRGGRAIYTEILADIDIIKMQLDPKYCRAVMEGLLRQSRVEEYLQRGLEDFPERQCGIYVGGIHETEEGYEKFFDEFAGEEAHNMPYMVNKRSEYKSKMSEIRKKQIARRKAEISRLQGEIDDLSR